MLTTVASKPGKAGKRFLDHLANAGNDANPKLLRIALKLVTRAGKSGSRALRRGESTEPDVVDSTSRLRAQRRGESTEPDVLDSTNRVVGVAPRGIDRA